MQGQARKREKNGTVHSSHPSESGLSQTSSSGVIFRLSGSPALRLSGKDPNLTPVRVGTTDFGGEAKLFVKVKHVKEDRKLSH